MLFVALLSLVSLRGEKKKIERHKHTPQDAAGDWLLPPRRAEASQWHGSRPPPSPLITEQTGVSGTRQAPMKPLLRAQEAFGWLGDEWQHPHATNTQHRKSSQVTEGREGKATSETYIKVHEHEEKTHNTQTRDTRASTHSRGS